MTDKSDHESATSAHQTFCVCPLSLGLHAQFTFEASHPAVSYKPLRPPALALAVRGPYSSVWSSVNDDARLKPTFWGGQELDWEGIAAVDGVSYELMGTASDTLDLTTGNLTRAKPLAVSYDSQSSTFTFGAGPFELTATFLSPVIPDNLCRTSIPLFYISISAQSRDNGTHDVQLYMDVTGAVVAPDQGANIEWSLNEYSGIRSWLVSVDKQTTFGEDDDQALWGNFTFSSARGPARAFFHASGFSEDVRGYFVDKRHLPGSTDDDYRAADDSEPVFAFAHDLGKVSASQSPEALYTLGHIEQPSIKYLTTSGMEDLQPWWTRCFSEIHAMIHYHYHDYNVSRALSDSFEERLPTDVKSYFQTHPAPVPTSLVTSRLTEEEAYYAIVALSTRQVMGAYTLTAPPSSGGCTTRGYAKDEPLIFQKEISSNGNTNTVDVLYPAMPFFLYAKLSLLRNLMAPLLESQECRFYPNDYSMHDLGSHFPNATGHVEGDDEFMPVEESGDMILMMLAYQRATGDTAWLQQHFQIMKRWAQYLIDYTLVPAQQLSTDDFAGQLGNQTNLALKGILALKAMSEISKVVGDQMSVDHYSHTADEYIKKWEEYSVNEDEKHTALAYDWDASTGLLYNAYVDKLLGLNSVPERIYDMQSKWYPQVAGDWGVPLDSRHSYTKSDWGQ